MPETIIEKNAEQYYKSSKALFLPVTPDNETDGFELKLGGKYYHFIENETPLNSSTGSRIADNKYCTNKILARAGIPVPKAIRLTIDEYSDATIEHLIHPLSFPLVIKPVDGSLGIGVLCNITSLTELKKHLVQYFSLYPDLIIEEFHGGLKSYRVLVFDKRVIGVVLRHRACVEGDGTHTIKELIHLSNIKRKTINEFLGNIEIDDECRIRLAELGLDTDYIPATGEQISLNYTSNATRGGTFETCDNQICAQNRKLMIQVANVLNLRLAGIDIECIDINLPIFNSKGVIIEVNHKPSIRIHELPMSGRPNYVTKKIMRSFIYSHPLSYFYSLYTNKPTSSYVRGLLLLSIIGVFYWIY